ncbi:MAG: hypothetical protein IPG04_17405 [Polyangiaceae bacterium]|nr:hypothetical protein [Polyangiaceae bacterium]
MSLQFSTTLRNAIGDVVESTIGTAPTLEIRTGAAPANCGTADSGTVLATMTLPSDWMAAASGGTKALAGTWEDLTADATGTAAHFRIKQGATCHMQGTCGMGTGDLQLDNTSIATGQKVTITSFTLTAPGV